MAPGPIHGPHHRDARSWQWASILVAALALLTLGVIQWASRAPDRYPAEHATMVLLPAALAAGAGASLAGRSRTGALLRAVAWGSLLAVVSFLALGR